MPWEAWSGGDKLEEPTSLVEAINQPVHQDQVAAHSVKEVVCSLVLKIRLVGHGFCVEWVAAKVLVDHEKKVKGAVERVKVRLSANRRLEPARRALWQVVFCVGGVAMGASARIGHNDWYKKVGQSGTQKAAELE